jgi:ADP-ribose pyrophosphatase YjhB (NUDIX family)
MKPKPFGRATYLRIYKKVPRICVELIVHGPKGVVLIKRGPHDDGPGKGTWHLPGKTMLYGETVAQAIRRAAKDETGLRVRVVRFLGYHEYGLKVTYGHPIVLQFLVKPAGGKLKDSNGRDIAYFKRPPKNTGFGHDRIIRKYIH